MPAAGSIEELEVRRRQRDRSNTGKRGFHDVAKTILLRLGAIVLLIAALVEVIRFRERRCAGCNVILISADTLRADHLGCHGYWRETSPAIDRLARESLLFANAYSASAWTLPGHMTMLTGRYAVRESEFVFMSGRPFPRTSVSSAGTATSRLRDCRFRRRWFRRRRNGVRTRLRHLQHAP